MSVLLCDQNFNRFADFVVQEAVMLAIRESETSEEEDDDEMEEEETECAKRVPNDCKCHQPKGQSHNSNKEGQQKETVFLSKRIDSKQRLRGYVNLRGIDVPLPWMIWYEYD